MAVMLSVCHARLELPKRRRFPQLEMQSPATAQALALCNAGNVYCNVVCEKQRFPHPEYGCQVAMVGLKTTGEQQPQVQVPDPLTL